MVSSLGSLSVKSRVLCCSRALSQAGVPFWKIVCHLAKPHQVKVRAVGWCLWVCAGQEMDDGQSWSALLAVGLCAPSEIQGVPLAAFHGCIASHKCQLRLGQWVHTSSAFHHTQPASTQPTASTFQGRSKPGACCYEHGSASILRRLHCKMKQFDGPIHSPKQK